MKGKCGVDIVCGCIADDARPALADVLNAFNVVGTAGYTHLSLDAIDALCRKYDRGTISLILTLLDQMDFVEHSGNLAVSSWLTERGEDLKVDNERRMRDGE